MEKRMSIDTLGYVKRLTAAGVEQVQAEAHAEALRDHLVPQLATSHDLEKLASRLEATLWKHSLAVITSVLAVGLALLRFGQH
jgi:hypothetical protein